MIDYHSIDMRITCRFKSNLAQLKSQDKNSFVFNPFNSNLIDAVYF